MAEPWPSGTIKGQKLEGYFEVTDGISRGGINTRELKSFSIRYPDGSKYIIDPGCALPSADEANPPNARTGSQVMKDALALMRDRSFSEQESARLNRISPDAGLITQKDISDFAKKLEDESCRFAASPPKPHAPNTFASRSIKNRNPATATL